LRIKSKTSSTEKEKPIIIEEPSVTSNLIAAVMKPETKPEAVPGVPKIGISEIEGDDSGEEAKQKS
jgi:hypothetical protein